MNNAEPHVTRGTSVPPSKKSPIEDGSRTSGFLLRTRSGSAKGEQMDSGVSEVNSTESDVLSRDGQRKRACRRFG